MSGKRLTIEMRRLIDCCATGMNGYAYGMQTGNTVERAFYLALETKSIDELKSRLKKEGHSNVDAHLSGPQIRTELSRIINRGAA